MNFSFRLHTASMFLLGVLFAPTLAPAEEPSSGLDSYEKHVLPFFKVNCIKCHGPEKSKGKITLHTLNGDLSNGRDAEQWELILEMLESGEMPPEDEPQPGKTERKVIVEWIEAGLREAVGRALLPVQGDNKQTDDKQTGKSAQPTTTRRLTNFEYQNTMRDLLGFELNLIENLPEDPVKPYHFNNTAEFMLIGPEQMDRYKENARRAMASAIVDPGKSEVFRTSAKWDADRPGKGGLTQAEIGVYAGPGVGSRAIGLKGFPATGEYRIRIKAAGTFPSGFTEVPLRLVMGTNLRHDGGFGSYHPAGTVHLTNDADNIQEFEFRGRIENIPVMAEVRSKKGVRPPSITITAQNLFDNGQLNDHRRSAFDSSWSMSAPRVVLQSLEFDAPVTDVWPPEHHTRILFKSTLRERDLDAYVREVLQRFMTRAFRRPVTDDEIDRFVKMYNIFDAEFDTLEQAMRETLAIVLISPQFLYHTVIKEEAATRQYEMASKLSYFLWGSMPDDKLINLAAQKKLDDPAVIKKQVNRLLADERSDEFVNNFTTQWLSIAKMQTVNVNRDLFPRFLYLVHVGERRGQEVSFRPTIRDDMHEETVGFVGELIKRNASVLNIVDSDFAYLNERLAVHYGIKGVHGNRLRPVAIKPEDRLGGLLTQGSVLVGNSTGSAPHPIYRAVWLREAILGDEVKPPPAEVPALSDSAGDSAEDSVSIKNLLALHRTKESCNDCHVRLDPWGIPFERYNAIGQFQPKVAAEGVKVSRFTKKQHKDLVGYSVYLDRINTIEVEAEARVPHGPEVDGMADLKAYLIRHRKDDIAENVIRRLLTYGLGRELTYRDRFVVERLLRQAKGNDYKLQDMIVAICQGETFSRLGTLARPQQH